ncbi:hypothetical protein ACQJBY_024964 [Aegilops geniculata]
MRLYIVLYVHAILKVCYVFLGDYYQDTKCQNLNGQRADYKSVVKGQVQNLFVLKTTKQEPEDEELHLHTT